MTPAKAATSLSLIIFVTMVLGNSPAPAGSMPIGMVAGSVGTAVAGHASGYDSVLFNSDSVQVRDKGTAIVKFIGGSLVVLNRQTEASFLRQSGQLNVSLSRGSLSILQPVAASPVGVTVAGISIRPMRGIKTLGDVALGNDRLLVSTRDGRLQIEGRGVAAEVAAGKTFTLNLHPAAAPHSAAIRPGLLGSHATKIAAATTAGGAGAVAGIAAAASHGAAAAAPIGGWTLLASKGRGSSPSIASGGDNSSSGSGGDYGPGNHNANAVNSVASHVPPQACAHAASPSVPAEACAGR